MLRSLQQSALQGSRGLQRALCRGRLSVGLRVVRDYKGTIGFGVSFLKDALGPPFPSGSSPLRELHLQTEIKEIAAASTLRAHYDDTQRRRARTPGTPGVSV